ncbi:MAG: hypothetical protein V4726_09415 [Verrucomicrobiota bacterium]
MILSADAGILRSFSSALPGAGAVLVLSLLFYFARRESIKKAGLRVFEYTTAMKVLAGFFVVGLCGGILFAEMPWEDPDAKHGLLAAVVINGVVLGLYLEVFFVRVSWDSENIHTRSPWRRSRLIPFSAVKSCDVSHMMQWYRIRTAGFGIVRLPFLGRGIPQLLAALPCPAPDWPAGVRR